MEEKTRKKLLKILSSPWTWGAVSAVSTAILGGVVIRESQKNSALTTRVGDLEKTVAEHEGTIKEQQRLLKKMNRENMSMVLRNHEQAKTIQKFNS